MVLVVVATGVELYNTSNSHITFINEYTPLGSLRKQLKITTKTIDPITSFTSHRTSKLHPPKLPPKSGALLAYRIGGFKNVLCTGGCQNSLWSRCSIWVGGN